MSRKGIEARMVDHHAMSSSVTETANSVLGTRYSALKTGCATFGERSTEQPPSRETNPFATCWTRPGALAFRFSNGVTANALVARLAANGWIGEIVGPHGCGKSTLLETLKPVIANVGRHVVSIALRDGQTWLPRDFWKQVSQNTVVTIDGYEQLSWLQRRLLKHHCRRNGAGLLVTSHAPMGLPTLIAPAPDLPLIQQLVVTLCERSATCISPADVAASHAGRGSNVRDIFFDLYDRHEHLRAGR